MMSGLSRNERNRQPPSTAKPQGLTLRGRFIVLATTFSLAIALLVGLSYIGFSALSGARAYVQGESQWTKAQKQAVIELFEYATTGHASQFRQFRRALEVIHGDRRARFALEQSDPDRDVAQEGFIAGRNNPDDVGLMITVFEWRRWIPLFDRAVDVWEQADAKIDELERRAQRLRRAVKEHGPGSAAVGAVLSDIVALNAELTRLETRFSGTMRQLSHQLATGLSLAILAMAVLLVLSGTALSIRLLRSSETSESALRESEERYRALVDQPEIGMWQLDGDGRLVYLNPAMRSLLGLGADDVVTGKLLEEFVASTDVDPVRAHRAARERHNAMAVEVELVPRSGVRRQVLMHGAPVLLEESRLAGHVGTCVDITDRKLAEEKLHHQAYHDPLTGLPNRALFLDRLEMALRRARREASTVAVLFVDLDRFKVVNDSMGHAMGDRILQDAASRLAGVTREPDTVARFGGDEFGIVLEGIECGEEAVMPARRVLEALAGEFEIGDISTNIGASIGIALPTGPDDSPSDLMRFADIAMFAAKDGGGDCWTIYDPAHHSLEEQRLHFETELWWAAERGELVLHYQPLIDGLTGKVESLEALVRWRHPEMGLLGPDQFIPTAEKTGAIQHIGHWVRRQACLDLAHLRGRLGKGAPVSVAVNISDREFRFGDPARDAHAALEEAGLNAGALCFEVTESLLVQNPSAICGLDEIGCSVAIDDFGTGYSSLSMLREVRFHLLKIDRCFVDGLPASVADVAVVESIVSLADRLGMRVVAEGVENAAQLEAVRVLGCDLVQGYLLSRPLALEDLLEVLPELPGLWRSLNA